MDLRNTQEGGNRHEASTKVGLRAFAEQAGSAVIELAADAKLLYVSPGFSELTGHAPDDVLGTNTFDLAHPEDADELRALYDQALSQESAAQLAFRMRFADGSWSWLELTGRGYHTSDGELRAVFEARAVTDRVEPEGVLEQRVAAGSILARQRRDVRRYWDLHPISTDSVPFERGTSASFEALYERWRKNGTRMRLEFLKACRGKKVLEVGCGVAADGRFLSENGIDYQAVDISRESLKLADEHFRQNDLRRRFTNADATRLPFADGTFGLVYSIGVLHHVPDTPGACREVARVLRPGGNLRVMLYGRNSYHYFLVGYVVRPLIWLLLQLPFGERLARFAPAKFRAMYTISKQHGFDKQRLLDISTDTSEPGEGNYNPLSGFYTEKELRRLFEGFEDFRFWKTSLKYFPLPFFRSFAERKWGFFLQMTARKRTIA